MKDKSWKPWTGTSAPLRVAMPCKTLRLVLLDKKRTLPSQKQKFAPPPWALAEDAFEKIAEHALAELPERILTLLANVPILVSDVPSLEIVAEGNDPRMMGFFSGVPYPEKTMIGGPPPHLDCIFLYQRNIERATRTHGEMLDEIRKTLLHETGHFFGLSEEDLEDIGLG